MAQLAGARTSHVNEIVHQHVLRAGAYGPLEQRLPAQAADAGGPSEAGLNVLVVSGGTLRRFSASCPGAFVSGPRDAVGFDGTGLVELAAGRPRAAALFDELAAPGSGEHALGGVGVSAILDRLNGDPMTSTPKPSATPQATSIRLSTQDLIKLDRVVQCMATSREARLVGHRWGRSTVLCLAVERGLDALFDEPVREVKR
jgi:hypothetical protein